ADAEILGGDVFKLMRLVDYERGARRDDLSVCALADRRVGAQQVMIDDDDVGFGGALAHQRDEAVAVPWAVAAQTRFGVGCDLFPEREVLRQIAELCPIASRRPLGPVDDDGNEDLLRRGERFRRILALVAMDLKAM